MSNETTTKTQMEAQVVAMKRQQRRLASAILELAFDELDAGLVPSRTRGDNDALMRTALNAIATAHGWLQIHILTLEKEMGLEESSLRSRV